MVFSEFWAGLGSCFVDFSGFSYFFMDFSGCFAVVWGAVLWISAVSATFFQNFSSFWAGLGSCFRSFMDYSYPGLQGIEQGIVQGRREERISTLVTFFKNDGTVAAAKQMLNSSDDDIKTAKERLSMIEE